MKTKLRCLYLWAYELVRGHLPPGTLVKFSPNLRQHGILREDPSAPSFDSLGVVLGGWSYYKHPGYQQWGSVVMIDQKIYDLKNFDLEVMN